LRAASAVFGVVPGIRDSVGWARRVHHEGHERHEVGVEMIRARRLAREGSLAVIGADCRASR
jgi:hypothetical protein